MNFQYYLFVKTKNAHKYESKRNNSKYGSYVLYFFKPYQFFILEFLPRERVSIR